MHVVREQAHALAVVPKHLDQVAAPAAEHEQVTAVRIAIEGLLDEERKPIKPLAHVGAARRQPHPRSARNRDRHRRSSAPIRRASPSSRIRGF